MRVWKKNLVKEGTVRTTNLGIKLFIESVSSLRVDEITDAHAVADGFTNREALIERLKTTYPDLPPVLTLLKFHVVD